MENEGQNGSPDLDAIRMMLADLATGQARHEHFMQQHAEWMARMERYAEETRKYAAEIDKYTAAQRR